MSIKKGCKVMEYEVSISFYNNGIKQTTTFRKDVNTLNELKESFLKRFGNINEVPNKALKEKSIVKELTYMAKSISEWVNLINSQTRWVLTVEKI